MGLVVPASARLPPGCIILCCCLLLLDAVHVSDASFWLPIVLVHHIRMGALHLSALKTAVPCVHAVPYTITLIPVVKDLGAAGLGLPLRTLVWALSFGACLGGNGTLIGASANIVTAGLANRAGYKISFMYWLKLGMPAMVVSVAVVNAYMLARYAST